ncbi:MAG: TetR/AcrR family transcriptional regulator [Myxococcales bacterium]|nr:TetR/AcrR family transcriptional regulator [Myxococcales bacterium]
MGRRKGPALTAREVVDAAIAIVQGEGAEALGISRVARAVGIRPASMYNHVASGDALARAVSREGTRQLLQALKAAVRGVVAPAEQLRRLAHQLRAWARDNGGLYALMARVEPDHDDVQAMPMIQDLLDLFERPLGQLGVIEEHRVHAMRSFRSAIHGFVLLETSGQFQLADDVEHSFAWMVDGLIRGLVSQGPDEPPGA